MRIEEKIATEADWQRSDFVPIAAKMLPTAPSDTFSRLPNHSMPLVKRWQPASVTTIDARKSSV